MMYLAMRQVAEDVSLRATSTMCVSVNQIYSVNDPISLRLSATVDPQYARIMAPVTLPRNTIDMIVALEQPKLSIKKWTEKQKEQESSDQQDTPVAERTSTDVKALEHAERRFSALNPYGAIDYAVETSRVNQFTQYLDMFQAHMCYWNSVPFANFLLRQLVPRDA